MTVRTLIQITMYIVGGGLIVALWNSGAPVERVGGWYVLGLLIALTANSPREAAMIDGAIAIFLVGYLLCISGDGFYGLGWCCVMFLTALAIGGHAAGAPTTDPEKIMKCAECDWQGERVQLRQGRCPKCSCEQVRSLSRGRFAHS